METTLKLYEYKPDELRAYVFALLFIAGNIILPQLCHLLPMGGHMLLPIYFFTLIAAYKYGVWTGVLTALISPLINNAFFGMPMTEMLPAILVKSVFLALAAAYFAHRTKKVSIISLVCVVLIYQSLGFVAEWGLTASLAKALQDIRLGVPGMILQVVGGYLLLNYSKKIS